ncbi:MAG: hypothetical protein V3T05_06855 [Myxococcota bacterium]
MARTSSRLAAVICLAHLGGCASTQSDAVAGLETGGRRLPFADVPMGDDPFSVAEAKSVVERIEAG